MHLGLSLGIGHRSASGAYNPQAALFASGEQGVWYDPSDFSTMYQDLGGQTPVTAVGQSVKLLQDKSKGRTLGADVIVNGDFATDTWWGKDSAWTISGGVATYAGATNNQIYTPASTLTPGALYEVTFDVAAVTTGGLLPVVSRDVNLINITATGTFTVLVVAAVDGRLRFGSGTGSTWRGSIDNVVCRQIAGNHATQATAASRPVLRQTAGGLYYLEFDGTDDFLVTSNIDFSATDEMTVIAGVRKLSDAAVGEVVGLSAAPAGFNGTFYLRAPSSINANYQYRSRGTTANGALYTNVAVAAPTTNVLTGLSDISAPSEALRVDGVERAANTLSQGTGNYSSTQPLYIGRTGGTSLPFNGQLYGLVVRGLTTAGIDLTNAESYIAGKTGVTL